MSEPNRPRSVQSDHIKTDTSRSTSSSGSRRSHAFRAAAPMAAKDGDVAPVGATLVDKGDRTWERGDARLLLRPQRRSLPNWAQRILYSRFVVAPSLTRSLGEVRGALVKRPA